MPAPDTAADLALLESAVRNAGEIARKFYGGTYKRWSKAQGSPVTEVDLAVDRYLNETLCAARPCYGWLSEETDDDLARLDAEAVFVVDPIDGTIAFMKNRPHFTICAAVVRAERPVAGVVYNPISEEFYSARLGCGATCNGIEIRVSNKKDVEDCRMLGDKAMFGHTAWREPPNIPWPEMHVESRNSIAYRMALVANGTFDCMMALSAKRDWDLAAAEIVLQEAGGLVTSHYGSTLRYNRSATIQTSVVGAGPTLHAKLLNRVSHIKLPHR